MGDGPIPCGRRQEIWEHAHRFDADGSNRAVSADRSSTQLCNGRKRMFADPSSPSISLVSSTSPPVHTTSFSSMLPHVFTNPPPPPHIGFFSFCLSYMYLYSRLLLLYSPSLWTKKYKRGEKTLTSIGKHKSSWRIHIFSSSAQQPMFSLSWRLPSFSGLDSLWKKKKWEKKNTYYENMDRGTHGCRDTVRRRK